MTTNLKDGRQAVLEQAFALMEEALDMLDGVEGPGQIGAYLDMAICELRREIDATASASALCRSAGLPFAQDMCAWPISPGL